MKRLLGLLVIIALAGGTVWYAWRSEPTGTQSVERPARLVDAAVEGFTAVYHNASGNPEYRLSGDSMVHYLENGTDLQRPHLTLFQPDSPPWHLYAGKGHVSTEGTLIHLTEGVRIVQPQRTDGTIEVVTDHLLVKPEEKYAETDAPVRMTGRTSEIHAVGLRAYVADERLILLSQVRGNYVPPTR